MIQSFGYCCHFNRDPYSFVKKFMWDKPRINLLLSVFAQTYFYLFKLKLNLRQMFFNSILPGVNFMKHYKPILVIQPPKMVFQAP